MGMKSIGRAALGGIDTGYVAVRADAWDTPAMKDAQREAERLLRSFK